MIMRAVLVPAVALLFASGAEGQRMPAPVAVTSSHRATATAIDTSGANYHRYAIVSGTLGLFVPGLGHVYCGEFVRAAGVFGVTMLGTMVAMADTTAVGKAGAVVMLGGIAFSVIDGARAASRYNRRHFSRDTSVARR